jgi:hypothetical protein
MEEKMQAFKLQMAEQVKEQKETEVKRLSLLAAEDLEKKKALEEEREAKQVRQ